MLARQPSKQHATEALEEAAAVHLTAAFHTHKAHSTVTHMRGTYDAWAS